MFTVNVKPFSTNNMYMGRKVKSSKYRQYEAAVLTALPRNLVIPQGKLRLTLKIGVSSTLSDLDNALKPFIDCLQLKYGFNDKHIYRIFATKEDVAKGKEYIKFEIAEWKGKR